VRDFQSKHDGRGFKGIKLKNESDQKGQIQLDSATAATAATGKSNCEKTQAPTETPSCEQKTCVASVAGASSDANSSRNRFAGSAQPGNPAKAPHLREKAAAASEHPTTEGKKTAWCKKPTSKSSHLRHHKHTINTARADATYK
jgi:hypothetical protein